jgi:hypothetical protein
VCSGDYANVTSAAQGQQNFEFLGFSGCHITYVWWLSRIRNGGVITGNKCYVYKHKVRDIMNEGTLCRTIIVHMFCESFGIVEVVRHDCRKLEANLCTNKRTYRTVQGMLTNLRGQAQRS